MMSYSPVISEKICSSISDFSINASGHHVRPIKIHAGRFNSYYLLVEMPDFSLMIRQVEHTYHEAGQFKEQSQGFISLSPGGSIIYNGNKFEHGHKIATLGRDVSSVLSTNLRMISCFINEDKYPEHYIEEEIDQLKKSIIKINHESQRATCDNHLSEYLYQLIYGLSNGITEITNEETYKDLRESLYSSLLNYTVDINNDTLIQINPKNRIKILNTALDYIHANDDKTIRVSDISRQVNTTQRNLQKLFDQYLGVSPKNYLISRKLNHIYNDLTKANPESTNVQQVALKYGVIHMGNFAKSYLAFFGEYPNETLLNKPKTIIFQRDERPTQIVNTQKT